jgi:hypothetical protein
MKNSLLSEIKKQQNLVNKIIKMAYDCNSIVLKIVIHYYNEEQHKDLVIDHKLELNSFKKQYSFDDIELQSSKEYVEASKYFLDFVDFHYLLQKSGTKIWEQFERNYKKIFLTNPYCKINYIEVQVLFEAKVLDEEIY